MEPSPTRILLVEDELDCRKVLERAIRRWDGVEVQGVATAAGALALLEEWRPDVLLLDLHLGEGGSGIAVAERASSMDPAPAIIVLSGMADRTETFRLAQLGAHAYLEKPFRPQELRAAVTEALEQPPNLEPLLRATVGKRTLREVVEQARAVMTKQAVARTDGNRTSAARILEVTRQNVQAILRKEEGSVIPPRNGVRRD